MTNRAIELLALPPNETLFLLDIGCGSGLSGEILDVLGHVWVGVDIAPSMLRKYCFIRGLALKARCVVFLITIITRVEVALEREVEGDLFLQDIGQGFGFRPGSFDGAIRCASLLIVTMKS